jgi:hypothetical protein
VEVSPWKVYNQQTSQPTLSYCSPASAFPLNSHELLRAWAASFRVAGWIIEQSPEAKDRAGPIFDQFHSQIKDGGATYHGFQHARFKSFATTLIPQLYTLICRVKLKYG